MVTGVFRSPLMARSATLILTIPMQEMESLRHRIVTVHPHISSRARPI